MLSTGAERNSGGTILQPAAWRVGRSELSPKEGDSTTDGLNSRCRQGQWANSRSAAAFLFSLIAGSLGVSRPRGGAETHPVAGRSPWIYGAGFCVSPSGPGRFQQHSHNGQGWAGQDGTASGPLPFLPSKNAPARCATSFAKASSMTLEDRHCQYPTN